MQLLQWDIHGNQIPSAIAGPYLPGSGVVRENPSVRIDALEYQERMKDINGRRARFTDPDPEYFARLRDELARGPKGMCDSLEYAPLDEDEKRIAALKAKIIELREGNNDTVPRIA